MKKIILPLFVCVTLLSCSTKKKAEVTTAAPVIDPYEQQVEALKTKFPDVTVAQLKQGHDLYYGTCTGCHGAKTITHHSEQEWPGILTNMAKKAKITQEEKDAISKYVNGVLLTSK